MQSRVNRLTRAGDTDHTKGLLESIMKQSTLLHVVLGFFLFSPSTCWAQEPGSFMFLPGDQLDAYWVVDKKVAPNFPRKALQKGEQGCATVAFIVGPEGTTSNHKIIVSSSDLFREASIKAAEKFLYKPSESNDEKVSVITINTFTYHITDGRRSDEEVREALNELCESRAMEVLGATADDPGAN